MRNQKKPLIITVVVVVLVATVAIAATHINGQRRTMTKISSLEATNTGIQAIASRQTARRLYERYPITIKESQAAQKRQLIAELENTNTHLQQILETTEQEK